MFRKMKNMIGDFLVKGLSPREIAFGISLGNFVGILPFLGLHTVMALGLAWLLRLNMGVVFLGTQISNPLSFPFILFLSAEIGSVVLHGTFLDLSFGGDVMLIIKHYLWPTLLGSILLGLAVGIVTYPITLRFARRFRS